MEATGNFYEGITFEMKGEINYWKLNGDILFFIDGKLLKKNVGFNGIVNVEKYLRSGVIEINGTYEYRDDNLECNGVIKCSKI